MVHKSNFPGAAIGLEPQDLKYDGSKTQVKLVTATDSEYVTVNRATRAGEATLIGNGNLLMAYVHVALVIEDSVVIANAVALAGHVHIEWAVIGAVGVHQFVHIGRLAMVGATRIGCATIYAGGNPARRSLNLVGLKRAGMADQGEVFPTLKKLSALSTALAYR